MCLSYTTKARLRVPGNLRYLLIKKLFLFPLKVCSLGFLKSMVVAKAIVILETLSGVLTVMPRLSSPLKEAPTLDIELPIKHLPQISAHSSSKQ